jgi:hypothetical protein
MQINARLSQKAIDAILESFVIGAKEVIEKEGIEGEEIDIEIEFGNWLHEGLIDEIQDQIDWDDVAEQLNIEIPSFDEEEFNLEY